MTLKNKLLITTTLIFFLLANTHYYWETKIGIFLVFFFLFLIVYFLVLTALLFVQTYFLISEQFKNRQRLFVVGLITTVLALCFFYPAGLINFERSESNSILIAQREGAANCMTTLKLLEDNTFKERNVCFEVTEITGTYHIKGDTIFFEKILLGKYTNKFYQFAVIKNRETKHGKYLGDLVRYRDYTDTSGMALWIIKNELGK